MPISIPDLSAQLATLKGGSPFYVDKLGPKQKIGLKDLGALTFPLNTIQVRAMLEKAQVAPFGKGHRTLVDRTVRDTWEINADQLDLSDTGLQRSLRAFLSRAAAEMNIEGGIKAEPYKLLIYEAGGFFAEHQDSEKLPGMFGTLLLGLPIVHEGGRLLIDPGNGQRTGVDFAENDAATFPAVAFFADRKHEVEPVTSGYRVVMVFNLVQADGGAPTKIDQTTAARELAPILAGQAATDQPFCLSLDHQYTDTNFSTGQLKGNDAVRVMVLREAAALAGLELRVGLIEQSVTAEWENADQFGQGYGYGYRSRRSRYNDYTPVGEPKTFAKVEVGEIHEEYLKMYHWLPEDGASIGQLGITMPILSIRQRADPPSPRRPPTQWTPCWMTGKPN
jgi:predicted 2-oxoglutarate/Fe(II)-dependent dioxygenase YbiX